MRISSWIMRTPREPMTLEHREEEPSVGEVIVEVAGCGVCHTDLGFFYDGVRTRHPLPLCLGHEVSGTVVASDAGTDEWLGRNVIVPAVIPCGACDACHDGRASICMNQVFPGNDVHGGFASHVKVPALGLCPVPDLAEDRLNPARIDLASLCVIADAVSTPYQALLRSGLKSGDVAVFVGVGGVGGFGVQLASALGASVVAIDLVAERLAALEDCGASLTLRADELEPKELKKQVRGFANERGVPSWRVKVFETSGTTAGQKTAFRLLAPGGYLGVVGFTPESVELRLSNLMAFDAVAQGTWGCLPEHYPAVVDLVLSGKVQITPFIEKRPMHAINQTFEALRAHEVRGRPVLVPEG